MNDRNAIVGLRDEVPAPVREWAERWSPGQPPPDLSADCAALIPKAVDATARQLRPVAREQLVVLLDQLFALYQHRAPANWEEDNLLAQYVDELADVPTDLVRSALKHVRRTFRFGFPTPADIRAPIETELRERRQMARRLKVAETLAMRARRQDQPPPATADEVARASELVERTVKALRAAEPIARPEPVRPAGAGEAMQRTAGQLAAFKLKDENDPAVLAMLHELGQN